MSNIFISHAKRDGGEMAEALVAAIEPSGRTCWIAPRDVLPGRTYPAQIMAAVKACDALVLLLTPGANDSADVLQEVQIAHTHRKLIVPVVWQGTAASDDLAYFTSVRHNIPWREAGPTADDILKTLPAAAETQAPAALKSIDPITAVYAAGNSADGFYARVRLQVKSVAAEGDSLWLNSEADYRDPRCLALLVSPPAKAALAARFGQDPATFFAGKSIVVEGTAKQVKIHFLVGGRETGNYYFQTHLAVDDAAQISEVEDL